MKPENRTITGQFPAGQSGNPGGRPKEAVHLRELARAHTEEALDTLVTVMRTGDERARAAAASAILDRGWGKPIAPVEVSSEKKDPLNLAQVRDAAEEFLRNPEKRRELLQAFRSVG